MSLSKFQGESLIMVTGSCVRIRHVSLVITVVVFAFYSFVNALVLTKLATGLESGTAVYAAHSSSGGD